MKFLWMALSACMFSLTASGESIDAPGKIMYKMPGGEIVSRSATLEVPARGQGKVRIKADAGSFEAARFFSKRAHGRTLFYVVFDEFPGRQEGQKAVYRGTYTRGTNLALYYGDVFLLTEGHNDDEALHELLSTPSLEEDRGRARYLAGFYFKADVK